MVFTRIALLFFLVSFCGCGSSCGSNSRHPAPFAKALLADAEAQGLFLIARGTSFYEIAPELRPMMLPKVGAVPPMTILKGQHFGAFDVSPDGRFIVAESDARRSAEWEDGHLVVFDADLNVVYEDKSLIYHQTYAPYRWSPDGRFISYAHGNDIVLLKWENKTYRVFANNHKPVVRDGRRYGTPSWSKDGKSIVYQSVHDEVVIGDVETGARRIIARGTVPIWSPDGSKIVFLSVRHWGPNGTDVTVHDVRTGQNRALFATTWSTEMAWMPDGEALLFRYSRDNTIYGPLMAWSFAENEVGWTGEWVAALNDAKILALPAAFRRRLIPQPGHPDWSQRAGPGWSREGH